MLGGRTAAVLAGLALLLLAGGIARGKRVALRITILVLAAAIAFDLVKDLDFEGAFLSAWILFGLWWFRQQFEADSDPARVRWGMAALAAGVGLAVLYAMAGSVVLGSQLRPEVGLVRTLESLASALAGSPSRYHALTQRADWFLASLPVVSYGLVILALTQLLRPVLAPRAAAADRERLQQLLRAWGTNHISHLAVHGAQSYHWVGADACIAFTLSGRTALALGDPIGPPGSIGRAARDFLVYCDRQDWTPAFYQVDDGAPYRELGMALVPIGAEALVRPAGFGLAGKARSDLRYAVHRCQREGVELTFAPGPQVLAEHAAQLGLVSGRWLQSHKSPELGYSLGTLATLSDPQIVVGLARARDGSVEAFVSWLPVPARKAWTLDLMRRRPDATYGVMEALIAKSIEEAGRRGVLEVSLGVAPRIIPAGEERGMLDHAMRAMYWGLDRFQRSGSLQRFKAKFGPCWEDRYLAIPGPQALPGVMGALVRAHLPTLSSSAVWLRSALGSARPVDHSHPVVA
jgi:phosphatidylglycerol lysyltransferase